ncbi:MAG TPA: flavodoxin domain-containing protein [Spirochaetia bacterium]|nr:flavodoxin domain-containing protein [Spirochaetia bacterium]
MKGILIYDSVFGNTEKAAQAVKSILSVADTVSIVRVSEIQVPQLAEFQLVVVGSPTRGFRPTEAIAQFLKSIPAGFLAGKMAAAFDTRIAVDDISPAILRFIVKSGGYAAPSIARRLEQCGARLLAEPEGFFVKGSEGPLKDGESDRAALWAKAIAAAAQR